MSLTRSTIYLLLVDILFSADHEGWEISIRGCDPCEQQLGHDCLVAASTSRVRSPEKRRDHKPLERFRRRV
jgi:hypothetical protein